MRRRRRRGRVRPWVVAVLLAASAPALANPAIVLTTDGGALKVDAYALEGEWMRLQLSGGGTVLVRLGRIERIVSDAEEPPGSVWRPPRVRLRFQAGDSAPNTPYGQLIFEAARRHRVNPRLVAAVVRAESAFDPEAVSSKGARGLMQLMPATAERFGIGAHRLFQPAANLEAGVRYLDWLSRRYGDDAHRVLAAYNAGEASVDRYRGVPPFRETRDYVRRVVSLVAR